MNAIGTKSILIVFIILFLSCEENTVSSREYPRLNTLDVTDISNNGATFNAEITYRGDFMIISYGFVWFDTGFPTLENAEIVIFTDNIQSDKFSAKINSQLEKNIEYHVRPFVITTEYTVYGKDVKFFY